MSQEEGVNLARPFAAPHGTWPADEWPVDVIRTDESGEVDLEQIEHNLSCSPDQRIGEYRRWFEFLSGLPPQGGGHPMPWNPEVLRRLVNHDVRFVVVGGVAAFRHGSARITEDVDVCAPLDHENAVRIIQAFADAHPRWRVRPDLPVITPDSANLYGLKNMYLRTDLGQLDVLGELPGIGTYEEVLARTVEGDYGGGVRCRVLDLDSLIAAKRTAGREKDKPAIRELEVIRDTLRRQNEQDKG